MVVVTILEFTKGIFHPKVKSKERILLKKQTLYLVIARNIMEREFTDAFHS